MSPPLPNRLTSKSVTFLHEGIVYRASVSSFEDGQLAEVFLEADNPQKISMLARELAVAASLALKHGCPPDTLRTALGRLSKGRGVGPLVAILDLIAREAPR